jgi:hypothetical protein
MEAIQTARKEKSNDGNRDRHLDSHMLGGVGSVFGSDGVLDLDAGGMFDERTKPGQRQADLGFGNYLRKLDRGLALFLRQKAGTNP